MKDMYESFAKSSIETGLLRKGYAVWEVSPAIRKGYDVLASKADFRHSSGRKIFGIEFKSVRSRTVKSPGRKVSLDGDDIMVYYVYIDAQRKKVTVNEALAREIGGSVSGLTLLVE